MENNKNLWKGLLWVLAIIASSVLFVAVVEHVATNDTHKNIGAICLALFIVFNYFILARYFSKEEAKDGKDTEGVEE